MLNTRTLVAAGVLVVLGLVIWGALPERCYSASARYGVTLAQCPDGEVHVSLGLSTDDLRRGQAGLVSLQAQLVYVVVGETDPRSASLAVQEATYALVRGDKETPLPLDTKDKEGEPPLGPGRGRLELPRDLEDGDYLLRVRAVTKAGPATLDAPLSVYAPAKLHVLTDRPLYEPGNTIKFRGVALRARDLVPLDRRPGTWSVVDAEGVTVLEEKIETGAFGIADGELPLDKSSPVGTWHVRFQSGGEVVDVPVEVKPFELPRFTVSVESNRPFVQANDIPRVRIDVRSAAGVPVIADLELAWRLAGAWPAPPEWLEKLPRTARSDRSGSAELELPRVPTDLIGKATLLLNVGAVDETGDRAAGGGAVQLAQDAIDVDLVTEFVTPVTNPFGNNNNAGLVAGMNNRAYLRVTTAAGVPLTGASITIQRAWDRKDKGIVAETDEDGVAALQLDPGPAINIVVPPLPIRLPPPPPPVKRTSLSELLFGQEIPLRDVAMIDRWNTLVSACARYAEDGTSTQVDVRVEPSGRVSRASGVDALSRCIGDRLVGQQLSAGGPRVLQVSYTLFPALASVTSDTLGDELPTFIASEMSTRLADARTCLGRFTRGVNLPRVLFWEAAAGRFSADFVADPERGGVDLLDASRTACVERALAPLLSRALPRSEGRGDSDDDEESAAAQPRFGAVRFSVDPVDVPNGPGKAQATTMLGYELRVSARSGNEEIGATTLRVRPGVVPPIRLRPSKVVASAGEAIEIEVLRGETFAGEIPKKLFLTWAGGSIEAEIKKGERTARYTLPADRDGWYEARFDTAVTRIFVPKAQHLTVDVKPDKAVYRPGELAKLAVTTRDAKGGTPAAVGLFGVDATLAQVTSLAGPDELDALTPSVTMSSPAFGVIDATALSLGRVRGKNAAAATVLLVTGVPTPAEIDVSTRASAQTQFDTNAPLADRFYTILDALYAEVRRFEATAPKADKLAPEQMLVLWDRAVENTEKSGKPVTDFFGRTLTLALLPDELIAQSDPRLLVADGTRLPEDVEAWIPFVKRSRS